MLHFLRSSDAHGVRRGTLADPWTVTIWRLPRQPAPMRSMNYGTTPLPMFDWLKIETQRKDVERFMVKLLSHVQLREATGQLRDEERLEAALGVRVTPHLNKRRAHQGSAFDAPLHDVTTSGLSFMHHRQFAPGDFVSISIPFDYETHHFLCEVRHCSPIGQRMYLTGCQLLERLTDPETIDPR